MCTNPDFQPGHENPCTMNVDVCECTDISNNLTPFQELLDVGAIIVWAHTGWDNTGAVIVSRLSTLMATYSNLYLQLQGNGNPALDNYPLDNSGALKAEWLTLIQTYQVRIIVGNDHFYDPPDTPLPKPILYTGARTIIDALKNVDRTLAEKIAYLNAQNLYRGINP